MEAIAFYDMLNLFIYKGKSCEGNNVMFSKAAGFDMCIRPAEITVLKGKLGIMLTADR